MKRLVSRLIFIQLLILSSTAHAQPNISFKFLSSKDGLAGDVVYALHQDKQGFLWIGTHRGLNRYDGYHFRLYAYDPSDSNSISGNHVHCIKEDAAGIIWLATNKGLNSLNPVSGKFTRYPLPDENMPEFMKDLFVVNDSILLVNTNTLIYRFHKTKIQFTVIKAPEKLSPFVAGFTAKFTKDRNGNFYLAGAPSNYATDTANVVIIDWQNATANYIRSRNAVNAFSSKYPIAQVYFDSGNHPWCFAAGDILVSKDIAGKKVDYPYKTSDINSLPNVINSFHEDKGERLWITTGAGLVLYNYHKNEFYRYQNQPHNNNSLPISNVTAIIKDRKGVYWLGTFGSGLCYFTLQSKFKNIIYDSSVTAAERKIYGMKTLHSGRIWVNIMGDNNKFLIEPDKTIHKVNYQKDFKNYTLPDSALMELIGRKFTSYGGKDSVFLYHLFKAKYTKDNDKDHIPISALKELLNMYLMISNTKNKVWIIFATDLYDGQPHSLRSIKQQPIYSTPITDEIFLIATTKGLFVYDTRVDSVAAKYLPQPDNLYSISSSFVQYFIPDEKDNYWIATADAGLDYWDTKTNRFYNYSTKNGLADNTVYMILPDAHGRLWLSTNKGLSCFDTTSKTFTNYDRFDGLTNTEFNSRSACTDKNGVMYFGGMNGIDYFHPDSFMHAADIPNLYVSGFKVHGQLQPITRLRQFGPTDNTISIEFSGNDFLNAAKTIFRYKLEGVDQNWVQQQGVNNALYSRLPPGNYQFAVQASYDGKNWGPPLAFDFKIATPWFQSWWFFALLLVFTVSAIYLLFRYRLQQQLKLLRVRNRINRDLHDDIGASLSSVKAYSEILSNDPGNTVIAGLIKESAEDMIEQVDTIAWAANPQHDSFESLIDKINRYALPACAAKNIQFQPRQNGIDKNLMIPGEIRQTLLLIAKEAINNTCKYSAADNCLLTAGIDNTIFYMEISDDGKGFVGHVNGMGNGLKNIRERIKEAGGKAVIAGLPGKGTSIVIHLPYPFKIPNTWDRKNIYQ